MDSPFYYRIPQKVKIQNDDVRKGLLNVVLGGETMNVARQCDTSRKVRRAIQNKYIGKLITGLVMRHGDTQRLIDNN